MPPAAPASRSWPPDMPGPIPNDGPVARVAAVLGLTVGDLAERLGVSRRTLEMANREPALRPDLRRQCEALAAEMVREAA